MEYVIKNDKGIIRLDKGDELFSSLKKFALENDVRCASVQGIGATDDLTIGVYDLNKGEYVKRHILGNREILSLSGNLTMMNGENYVHVHIVTQGQEDFAIGGHLFNANISMTAEIFVDLIDYDLQREFNNEVKINTLLLK